MKNWWFECYLAFTETRHNWDKMNRVDLICVRLIITCDLTEKNVIRVQVRIFQYQLQLKTTEIFSMSIISGSLTYFLICSNSLWVFQSPWSTSFSRQQRTSFTSQRHKKSPNLISICSIQQYLRSFVAKHNKRHSRKFWKTATKWVNHSGSIIMDDGSISSLK